MIDAATEQKVLKLSVVLTAVLGGFAVLLGLLSGSMSIVFDGLFSVIDVAMGLLGLWVARLVTREENRTFQYGYWHIEPMSLAFYGGMLIGAVRVRVRGRGRQLPRRRPRGRAGLGARATRSSWQRCASACTSTRSARTAAAKSDFLHLDAQGWLMSALATAALVVAFAFAWAIESTPYAYLAPYVDPTVLGLLSLAMIPIPIRTVRQALREILADDPQRAGRGRSHSDG